MRDLFDADHAAFAESFRQFVERDAGEPDVFARAGKAGLLGMRVAEEFGGGGVDDPRFCLAGIEELAAAGRIGLALAYAGHAGAALDVLAAHASAAHQADWLPRLVSGDLTQ